MFTKYRLLTLVALFTLGAALVGCSKEAPPAAPEVPAPPEPVTADAAADVASPSAVPEGIAALPEADRAAALAQKVCPVSGNALGDMGTPIKVTVGGRDVFICCESCKEPLLADPDKYLAKLEAK